MMSLSPKRRSILIPLAFVSKESESAIFMPILVSAEGISIIIIIQTAILNPYHKLTGFLPLVEIVIVFSRLRRTSAEINEVRGERDRSPIPKKEFLSRKLVKEV